MTFKHFGLALMLTLALPCNGQLKLPALISDGMVLQREQGKIWGYDAPNRSIVVDFADRQYTTVSDAKGLWQIEMPGLKAGGPYSMIIKGSTEAIIKDVLVGDVWVCSGQSNMELNMRRASPLYGDEIAASRNDHIRYFAAPQTYNFNKMENDYPGGKWQKADPETVLNFGAIAYFFAKEIHLKYGMPVGMINTAIGGTPTEAWMSEDALKGFPNHLQELYRFRDKELIARIEKDNREKPLAWYAEMGKKDEGHRDPASKWTNPDMDTDSWSVMNIPRYFNETPLGSVNGTVWFRKSIHLTGNVSALPAKLLLGRIVDADSVFVNGAFIGTTSYQYPPRRYEIPAGVLHEGSNTIVVKLISNSGTGGFVPDKVYRLTVGSDTIDLAGDWYYKPGASMRPLEGGITVKYKPAGLFNAMISPLLGFHIKGVLWYQGESNSNRSAEQKLLFPALIRDWRSKWNQGDFPFLFVQLPNFMNEVNIPSESSWALFREAQLQGLSLPNTAMAVTIDVGEWNDIHPLNKLDVAHRLSLAAQKTAYGETDIVHSGPLFQTAKIKERKIIVSFTNTGSGLMAKGDTTLNYFAIAGEDKKFKWAEAVIKKNKVVVSSTEVPHPVAVRYAWADNPRIANLYNKEGLPASPFRTDTW